MLTLYILPTIVISFLLFTLVVGIYYSGKITSLREYAIGNKNFATATLVATLLATLYGGGALMRTVQQIYNQGIYYIIILLADSISIWIWTLLIPHMGPFMYHLSTAESIGSVYGTWPRIISALFGVVRSLITIVTQINVVTSAVTICIPKIDSHAITVAISLIFVTYSSLGGIRSVTFTDVMQFITFTIVIPFFTWYMYIHTNQSVTEIIDCLKCSTKFQMDSLFQLNRKSIGAFMLVLAIIMPSGRPSMMQRMYMSSGVTQAKKVFYYTSIFNLLIVGFIIFIGLFTIISINHLSIEEIWPYIVGQCPPILQASILIGLIAMTMSTADSSLNNCATMLTHDLLANIYSKWHMLSEKHQLYIVRISSLVTGLLAMIIAFYCNDLFRLLCWALQVSVPITAAPLLLAVFGFRSTSRTALIGMGTGVFTILIWNKLVQSSTGIDGSVLAMLANGLAMMSAHYLSKQPKDRWWIGIDDTFKQIKQENSRKRAERQETIKNYWTNRKDTLAKLMPSHTTMVYVGLYITITSLFAYSMVRITNHDGCWLTIQLFGSACCLGYPFLYDISKKIRSIPSWFIGLYWLIGLSVYLPMSLLLNWWYPSDLIFTLSLSFSHLFVILWIFPLYIGIRVVAITSLVAIYPIYVGCYFPVLGSLLPLCMMGMLVFAIIICFKIEVGNITTQNIYLKNQEKIRESQRVKASLYDAAMVPSNGSSSHAHKGYGFILNQVVGKIEESISFLDNNIPIYKQDLQSIINKFYDWITYFNRREKYKDHALLQPTKITFDKLIRKVEVALSQEITDPPRILLETINDADKGLSIIGDINQLVYLLVQSVLRIGKIENDVSPVIRIQLHSTTLHFIQADPIDNSYPTFMDFKATALVISHYTVDAKALPKVKKQYDDLMDYMGTKGKQEIPPSIDLQQQTLSTIIEAHYGYLEAPDDASKKAMLLVLPNKVTDILSKMTTTLPIDSLTLESPVTPKEQADSMMELMQFHDCVCKSSLQEDPIDMKIISGLILLLRKHFGFKRHDSGQLFYVRSSRDCCISGRMGFSLS